MTEVHGMVPEDVEKMITIPLEQTLNGATGVTRVRSSSGLGLSIVYVEFEWNSDLYRNRQVVAEKLQIAAALMPKEVSPQILPNSSIMGQIQKIGFYSKGETSLEDMASIVNFDLKYRLMSVRGVAKIIVAGGAPMQVQVRVDMNKLSQYGINFYEIAEKLEAVNQNTEGGFIEIGEKSPVISYRGRFDKAPELEVLVVGEKNGRKVQIKDIATVSFGPSPFKTGDAGVNGKKGLTLTILKQSEADTKKTTEEVDKILADFSKTLPEDLVVVNDLFKQADFIDRAIHNVIDAVRDGAILVVFILLLFLASIRTTLITLIAIPLSVVITAIFFAIFDISLNTMTLGGLAVAIGALVDDAIVYMENIFRRLKLASADGKPSNQKIISTILEASSEIRNPVLIGTLIVIAVYLPLFFLEGMEGRLFMPIGIAYVVSIIASLFVAIIFTPTACYFLLPKLALKRQSKDTYLVSFLKKLSEVTIRWSIKHATKVIGVLAFSVLLSIVLLMGMGTQFLPSFNEGVAQINLSLEPETGLEFSSQMGKRLENAILSVPSVKSVSRNTGRAEGDEHAEGVNTSELLVTFKEGVSKSKEELLEEIRQATSLKVPGIQIGADQPLQHLISHMISGVNAHIAIKVYGDDIVILGEIAQKVKNQIAGVKGVKDLMVEQLQMSKVLTIRPNQEKMKHVNLDADKIKEVVENTLGGEAVTHLIQGSIRFPVVISLKTNEGVPSLEEIKDMPVFGSNQERYRLGEVASIEWEMTPNNINRENVNRRIVIKANVGERSLGEVVGDIKKELVTVEEDIKKYKGYTIVVSGQFEAQEAATKKILWLSLLALAFMIFILFMHYGSIQLSMQVLVAIPMAFIGAVVFLVIANSIISVATLVGFISLGGIAARNVILLIDHYLHLMKYEGHSFGIEMIVEGGKDRMMPVLMTALCSGIALVPLVLSPNEPGKEILVPIAMVIMGGLISSTILNFVVTPAYFWLFGEKAVNKIIRKET
jgi:CzcA family heavy metal efflux pump